MSLPTQLEARDQAQEARDQAQEAEDHAQGGHQLHNLVFQCCLPPQWGSAGLVVSVKASGKHLLHLVLSAGFDGLPHSSVGIAAVPKQHAAVKGTHPAQSPDSTG